MAQEVLQQLATGAYSFKMSDPNEELTLDSTQYTLAETLRIWGIPRAPLPSFEVRLLSGQVIDMRPYSTRIHENTDISWIIQAVANVLAWPPSYLSVCIGQRHFQYVHLTAHRDRTTLLQLAQEQWESIPVGHSQERLVIYVTRRRPPGVGQSTIKIDGILQRTQ